MNPPSGGASENGKYDEMRKKIAQVATKALRAAAKASKTSVVKSAIPAKPANTGHSVK